MNNIENIQGLLNFYKRSSSLNILSNDFLMNEEVSSAESLMPDVYEKTKIPIDHDECFYIDKPNYAKKAKKNKFDTYHCTNKHIKGKQNWRCAQKNLFPKVPFFIPHESKEGFLTQNEKRDLKGKYWVVSYYFQKQLLKDGPVSSNMIFSFLSQVYSRMTVQEKSAKHIMIIDVASDIYYHPQNLLELLQEAYGGEDLSQMILKPLELRTSTRKEAISVKTNMNNFFKNIKNGLSTSLCNRKTSAGSMSSSTTAATASSLNFN